MSADHRVELPGGSGWSLWRWFVLRGAGFDAARLLRLAVPDLAGYVQRLERCEDDERRARDAARDAIAHQLEAADPATRPALAKLRRKIADGGPPPKQDT